MTHLLALALCALAGSSSFAAGLGHGAGGGEIVIGTLQDLSGPRAAAGTQISQGMLLRLDEVNEQGGIGGRRLRLLVQDHADDPRKALRAAQKLVDEERIFAMVASLGTAQNMAALPVQLAADVVNFFPVAAARPMYEPVHRLKYAFEAAHGEQMRAVLPGLAKDKAIQRLCILYPNDDVGLDVLRGADAALKSIGLAAAVKSGVQPGATTFRAPLARLQAARCELVVLGTDSRETIAVLAEARRTGYAPVFLASSAVYEALVPAPGDTSLDGLYAVHMAQHPSAVDAAPPLRFWATKFRTRFNADPTVFAAYGYAAVDAFAHAARHAGPRLTVDRFVDAMQALTLPADMFGSPEMSFTATRHLGSNASRLSRLEDGRWKVVAPYR
jgi:branched-chain amino acid transport system substrate-binding protein